MLWADWMVKGTRVVVFDKPGKIVKVETANVKGQRTVKFIYVKLTGGKFINPYLPEYVTRAKK